MATENGTTVHQPGAASAVGATDRRELKGKGKAAATDEPVDTPMGEDEDEDEDDDEEAEEADDADDNEDEEEGMEEIDLNNIIPSGRRTRGKVIDFAKAAEENPPEVDDEDEDEDDDFQAPDEDKDKDTKMEED